MFKTLVEKERTSPTFENAYNVLTYGYHKYDGEALNDNIYEDVCLEDFKYFSGQTKLCIDLESLVLKTNFIGTAYYAPDDREADDGGYIFSDEQTDYCKIEYKVYLKACEEGVEKFFAPMVDLGGGIYAQERVDYVLDTCMTQHDFPKGWEKYDSITFGMENCRKMARKLSEHDIWDFTCSIREDAVPYFYLNYSFEDLKKLCDFLRKYDIDDIHTGNIGFAYNSETGKYDLKIFDYSGFQSSTEELIEEE